MRVKKFSIFVFFLFITFVIFRQVFLNNRIPFASNLLVSFYQPWFSDVGSGYVFKPMGVDDVRIFYPQRVFAQESLSKFSIPFWNPYNFSGNVSLANSQTAVFYPLNFIYFLTSPINAWTILVILGVFLLFVFTYLFTSTILKSKLAAVFSSLAFTLSGPVIVRIEDGVVILHSFLWLPLILFSFEKFIRNKEKKYLIIAFFGLLSSILSGWFQFSFYVIVFSFIYLFSRLYLDKTKKINFKNNFAICFLFILVIGITVAHVLPSIEALQFSPRSTEIPKEFIDDFLLEKRHLITALEPDFFGNPGVHNFWGNGFYKESVLFVVIGVLLFSLFEMFSLRKRKLSYFFSLITIFCVLYGFKNIFSLFILNLKLPVLSSFVPSRVFIISAFCLACLAGLGFQRFFEEKNTKENVFPFVLSVVVLSLGYYLIWGLVQNRNVTLLESGYNFWQISQLNLDQTQIIKRNLVLPFLSFSTISFVSFVSLLFKKSIKKIAAVMIILISLSYQLYFCNKYLFFSERKNVFPNHSVLSFLQTKSVDYFRSWSYGEGYINPNFQTVYKIYSPDGVEAMYPVWYGRLFEGCGKKGEYDDNPSRIEAKICYSDYKNQGWDDFFQKRLLNLLSVKYIAGLKKDNDRNRRALEQNIGPQIWEDDKWEIFENINVLPRTFLAFDYEVQQDDKNFLKTVYSQFLDIDKTIVLEKEIEGVKKQDIEIKDAKIIDYSGNKVVIEGEVDSDAILYLSDTYYPGWEAFIDGKPTDIIRANYAFRAVRFPEGKHTVVFRYFPKSFKNGLVISIISLIFLIVLLKKIRFK